MSIFRHPAFCSLVGLLGLAIAPAAAAFQAGGPDKLLRIAPQHIASFEAYDLDFAQNGDIYVALASTHAQWGGDILLLRSEDGGDTWLIEDYFADGDSDPTTGYSEPSLLVAEGAQNRIYLAYVLQSPAINARIMVSHRTFEGSIRTTRVAMADPGRSFRHPSLTSDAVTQPNYKLFLAAEAVEANGNDIWFSRSTDFNATWEVPYPITILTNGDRDYRRPELVWGIFGLLHCVWDFTHRTNAFDGALRYRRATTSADGGIADWQATLALTSTSDGMDQTVPEIAAGQTFLSVVITCPQKAVGGFETDVLVRASVTAGATWPPDSVKVLADRYSMDLAVDQSLESFTGVTEVAPDQTLEATFAAGVWPAQWVMIGDFTDRPYADNTIAAPVVAYNPRYQGTGVVWTKINGAGTDSLFFDGSWLGAPSFPRYAAGFPKAITSAGVSPPAAVNLDDDPELEIVFGDAAGNVNVWSADGTTISPWPRNVGSFPEDGPIAIADLNGDGHAEVAAGNAMGQVYAWDRTGTPLAGFPLSLGATGGAVYCSIGPVVAGSARQIAACLGNQVHLLLPSGASAPGFPVTLPAGVSLLAPAAIGDVDADGASEIVVAGGDRVLVIENSGVVSLEHVLVGRTISKAPSLADVDGDSDLEIAVPTEQGEVHLLHHDGTAVAGAWPFTTDNGTPVTSVAFADVLEDGKPELVFAEENAEMYLLRSDGSAPTGWPVFTAPGFFLHGMPTVEGLFGSSVVRSVLVGSLDGSGYGFSHRGLALTGWPKDLAGACRLSAASGDLDHDGMTEAVFVTESTVVVLDFLQSIDRDDPTDIWPMYGYNPARTFCLGCGSEAVVSVPGHDGPEPWVEFAIPIPNPSRETVAFEFRLHETASVHLSLLDVTGRVVRVLADGDRTSGAHRLAWNGRDARGSRVPPGLYFARLAVGGSGGSTHTHRIVVLP